MLFSFTDDVESMCLIQALNARAKCLLQNVEIEVTRLRVIFRIRRQELLGMQVRTDKGPQVLIQLLPK